jgi:carboxyl-terminal processing protease
MNIISADYVDDVEQRKLFEGAMDGMVGQLDPYSGYSPPEEYQQFQEQMDQGFVGIGIFVELDPKTKRLTIKSPLVGSPAFKAGIRPDDMIMAIDGTDTTGMTLKDSTTHIKGKAGTSVTLTISTREKLPRRHVEREIPSNPSMAHARRRRQMDFPSRGTSSIGYIRIHNFGERTAGEPQTALIPIVSRAKVSTG